MLDHVKSELYAIVLGVIVLDLVTPEVGIAESEIDNTLLSAEPEFV